MSKMGNRQSAVTGVDRATCLCFHAQRAARSLARRFDEAFRPVGLTNGQYSLLVALNQTGPVSIAADPADKRNRRVALTKIGHAALAAARPLWQATHREIEKLLGPAAPDRLREDLRALF